MRLIERAAMTAYRGIYVAVCASDLPKEQRRAASLYLLVTSCNVPSTAAAKIAGCTKQNVSKLLRAMEDRRENAAVDDVLTDLENKLSSEVQ